MLESGSYTQQLSCKSHHDFLKVSSQLDFHQNSSSKFRETDNFRLCLIHQLSTRQNLKNWLLDFLLCASFSTRLILYQLGKNVCRYLEWLGRNLEQILAVLKKLLKFDDLCHSEFLAQEFSCILYLVLHVIIKQRKNFVENEQAVRCCERHVVVRCFLG